MSLKTAFLNLFKPEANEKFPITGTEGYNSNMDLIDAAVKKNAEDITQLNSDIKYLHRVYAVRGVITAGATITIDFPKNLFSKAPVVLSGVESNTVIVNVVMDSTTKDKVDIRNNGASNVFFSLIAIEP